MAFSFSMEPFSVDTEALLGHAGEKERAEAERGALFSCRCRNRKDRSEAAVKVAKPALSVDLSDYILRYFIRVFRLSF